MHLISYTFYLFGNCQTSEKHIGFVRKEYVSYSSYINSTKLVAMYCSCNIQKVFKFKGFFFIIS